MMTNYIPEVGETCEVSFGGDRWEACEFIGLRSSGSHVLDIEGEFKCYHPHQVKYRPLKPKEDKEREEGIEELRVIIISNTIECDEPSKLAGVLYDVGYRKQGEVVSPEQMLREFGIDAESLEEFFEEGFVITRKEE